jgi:ribulose-phosphate 3-epimerase
VRGHRPALRLAPSLLSADFADLAGAIRRCEEGGAGALHLDVMDGHFVPNLTFGPALVRSVRARTRLPLDVHLMIDHPARFAKSFAEAGGSTLVFHVESSDDARATIRALHDLGVGAGAAIRPGTPFEALAPLADQVEQLLVMSVEPGFSGQSFRPEVLPKVRAARAALDEIGSTADVSIDGGITVATAPGAAREGASFFVCGNSVFVGGEIVENLHQLRRAVDEGAKSAVP